MVSRFQKQYEARLSSGALQADAAQEIAVAHLAELSERLRNWAPKRRKLLPAIFRGPVATPRGLYIHGKVGRGKTMLMDLFFETAPLKAKRRIHFHQFMAEAHDMIGEARKRHDGDPLPIVARRIADQAALLCFDEMHITDIADAMILGRLFKWMFEYGVVVVATSNSAPEDLYKNGLNRQLFLPFVDLLTSHMRVIELKAAKDYRLSKLSGRKRYFWPLDDAARRAMDELWQELGGGLADQPRTLEVKGRLIQVPRALLNMARFQFADLCAKPLGTLDYLAIAQDYDTIFIDDVPVLTADRRNEARRFINLIDTLYDNRISLIMSADAEADRIYLTGDGADLFERTASRLIEMRSDDYLKRRATRQSVVGSSAAVATLGSSTQV